MEDRILLSGAQTGRYRRCEDALLVQAQGLMRVVKGLVNVVLWLGTCFRAPMRQWVLRWCGVDGQSIHVTCCSVVNLI